MNHYNNTYGYAQYSLLLIIKQPAPMMSLLSPICLILALLLAIVGFGLCAVEMPSSSVELHAARAAGDSDATAQLERHLHNEQWQRRALITGLFVGSAVMFTLAFTSLSNSAA